MADYDLSRLPASEFENLCRDLLQKKEGCFIESFKEGRDGGIDLRYAKGENANIIVQAKCYKDWTTLKPKLHEESLKLINLNPDRYVFMTSSGLSPDNKEFIKSTFLPYIKQTEDIYGSDDINNLLGLYPDIEKKYHRLWLCSTNVLETILQKRIVNWTELKLKECYESKKTFVYNENYTKAKDILNEYKYVIISGIPGIGKSTLAEILVLEYLKNGFEEFVYIPDDIQLAFEAFDKNKKQIFLFDDFLGSNSLDQLSKNFDGNLVSFIHYIQNSENKRFILTTREYIWKEALLNCENLANNHLELAKCTINLGAYTNRIRAEMLYNHLFFAGVPVTSMKSLFRDDTILSIIKHRNFSPRLVETIVIQSLWDDSSVGSFSDKILALFDHPDRIWDVPFRKLNDVAHYALLVLSTMPNPVLLDDWRSAFLLFAQNTSSDLSIARDEQSWKDALRILDGCFVKSDKHIGNIIVNFYNPSILDYLIDHLNTMRETVILLIKNVKFADQLSKSFILEGVNYNATHKIRLETTDLEAVGHSFMRIMSEFQSGKSIWASYQQSNRYEQMGIFQFIRNMLDLFPGLFDNHITWDKSYLSKDDFINMSESIYYKIYVLQKLENHLNYLNIRDILNILKNNIKDIEDLIKFLEYINSREGLYDVMSESEIENTVLSLIENSHTEEDLNYLDHDLFSSLYGFVSGECQSKLMNALEEKTEQIKLDREYADNIYDEDFYRQGIGDEDSEIIDYFQSLRRL